MSARYFFSDLAEQITTMLRVRYAVDEPVHWDEHSQMCVFWNDSDRADYEIMDEHQVPKYCHFTFGETLFHFLVLDYLATGKLSEGLAVFAASLVNNAGHERKFKLKQRTAPRFQDYPLDVTRTWEGDANNYVYIAARLLELEVFNTRMRSAQEEKDLNALQNQLTLNMCIECGTVMCSQVGRPSTTCSQACLQASSDSKRHKDLYPDHNGRTPEGSAMLMKLSRYVAELQADVARDHLYQHSSEGCVGSTLIPQLGKPWDADQDDFMNWHPPTATQDHYYWAYPLENPRGEWAGTIQVTFGPTVDIEKLTIKDKEKVKGLEDKLWDLAKEAPNLYLGEIGDGFRADLKKLAPNHPLLQVKDPEMDFRELSLTMPKDKRPKINWPVRYERDDDRLLFHSQKFQRARAKKLVQWREEVDLEIKQKEMLKKSTPSAAELPSLTTGGEEAKQAWLHRKVRSTDLTPEALQDALTRAAKMIKVPRYSYETQDPMEQKVAIREEVEVMLKKALEDGSDV